MHCLAHLAPRILNATHTGLIYLLWGGFAQKKGALVDLSKHRVLTAEHPSPLSGTFSVTRPFQLLAHLSQLSQLSIMCFLYRPHSLVGAGFLSCRHFSEVNKILLQMGKDPIDWRISE